jgi:N-methylhydantoinase A
MRYMIAADTGGTFTDVAVFDAETRRVVYGKTLSNYTDLVEGVLEGLQEIGVPLERTLLLKHGTTHVINTFTQRNGARTALITTRGFRDVIEIARGNRPVPLQLNYRRDPPLIPRTLRFEVVERIDNYGKIVTPLDEAGLLGLAEHLRSEKVESVAISFLNAYANSVHEDRAAELLAEHLPGVYITTGTSLTGEWFEFERTSTAAANAYVGARMRSYIEKFDVRLREKGFRGRLYMMGSNGGVLSVTRTLSQPVALVESGPVGGCIGAAAFARALGRDRMIALDMGGTTAKCALVQEGQFEVQPIHYVGGYDRGFPLKIAVLDIIEVGAGGGSIASVDAQGQLTVGPRSAGSEPGPVAFGRGGTEPTVTDANLVLGRIGTGAFLQGKLRLDSDAAEKAVREKIAAPLGYDNRVDVAAQGILDLATATMAGAIKEITIERGLDARDFTLFVFGGGGPLFGSILARTLHIPEVIVSPHPGNFSTLGMLIAGARIDLSRTIIVEANDASLRSVNEVFAELEVSARTTMKAELGADEVSFDHWLEVRYHGQTHNVRVAYSKTASLKEFLQAFETTYKRRYGHTNANCDVEILGLHLGAQAGIPCPDLAQLSGDEGAGVTPLSGTRQVYYPAPYGRMEVPVWRREALRIGCEIAGPAIVEEYSATTVLLPGDTARVGALGEIVIKCGAE